MPAVVTLTDSPPTKEGSVAQSSKGDEKHLRNVFFRETLPFSCSLPHPLRHFASGKRAAAAEESILMVSGSLTTANSIGASSTSRREIPPLRPILPKPPSLSNLLDRPIAQADGVGNANELSFSLSQRVTARSEQHLSAFGIFRSFAKIDLATAVQCQLGAGTGGTDLARF